MRSLPHSVLTSTAKMSKALCSVVARRAADSDLCDNLVEFISDQKQRAERTASGRTRRGDLDALMEAVDRGRALGLEMPQSPFLQRAPGLRGQELRALCLEVYYPRRLKPHRDRNGIVTAAQAAARALERWDAGSEARVVHTLLSELHSHFAKLHVSLLCAAAVGSTPEQIIAHVKATPEPLRRATWSVWNGERGVRERAHGLDGWMARIGAIAGMTLQRAAWTPPLVLELWRAAERLDKGLCGVTTSGIARLQMMLSEPEGGRELYRAFDGETDEAPHCLRRKPGLFYLRSAVLQLALAALHETSPEPAWLARITVKLYEPIREPENWEGPELAELRERERARGEWVAAQSGRILLDPHGLADLIKALPCQALDLVFPPELLPEYELEEMVALRVCALQSFLRAWARETRALLAWPAGREPLALLLDVVFELHDRDETLKRAVQPVLLQWMPRLLRLMSESAAGIDVEFIERMGAVSIMPEDLED
uniref:Uncharacterized protein n=1 Tax=Emiliania huxleyi TaxID=2903 RepID=A0A7S3S7F2_EMIHU